MKRKIASLITLLIFLFSVCSGGVYAAGITVSASYSSGVISISGTAQGASSVAVQIWDGSNNMAKFAEVAVTNGTYSFSYTVQAKDAKGTFTIKVANGDGGPWSTTTVVVEDTIAVTGVSLNKTELSLTEGASETLIATVSPENATNKQVTWSSSNSSVAEVNQSGTVTAVAEGTATITVTTVDGGKTATCNVTVTAATVPVESVSLNKTELTLEKGKSETLVATISPANASNKQVTWSSSNSSVATVSQSGTVTAVAEGTATITVTTVDGGKTATCTVTVTAVRVTGVTLNRGAMVLKKNERGILIATVYPENASDKQVTWSSSNSNVAVVDASGVVTAIAEGTAIITAKTVDGGFTATCIVEVKSESGGGTGTTEYVDASGNINVVSSEVGDDGKLSVSISNDTLQSALGKADNALNINVHAPANADNISVSMPAAAVTQTSGIENVNIDCGLGQISFSPDALKDQAAGADTININIHKLSESELPASVAAAVGNNAVYDLSIYAGSNRLTSFNSELKITLPYTLKEGENPENIVVYYINSSGQLEVVTKCKYDSATKTVTFYTNHLSMYVAKHASVAFTDIAGYKWAEEPINALYARQLINGVGNNQFAPGRNITRAEFIKMLINALGLVDPTATADFEDVPAAHWAYKYVASAKKLGITTGITSTYFGANEYITRQDMAVLLYRALNVAKIKLQQDSSKPQFSDIGDAAAYAVEAIDAIYRAGIVSGSGSGNYNPKSNATRAEVAKIIYAAFNLSLQ